MKITRALLLSSQKQAEAWERPQAGHFFGIPLFETKYRFLITEGEEKSLRFQVFCVAQHKDEDGHMKTAIAEQAHVDVFFGDMGRLINFLHRYQIDFESAWSPVEESNVSR